MTGRADHRPIHRAGPSRRPPSPAADRFRIIAWAFVACFLVLDGRAFARAGEADVLFADGRRAFEAQHLEEALAAFEAAVRAGMTGPAVHYNIGVTAYRLGSLDKAEAAFREVAAAPEWAALAHYNLGLVALKKEDRTAARSWFQSAAAAGDPRLRGLAERQLAILEPGVPQAPALAQDWSLYGSLVLGHDSNVELLPDTAGGGVSGRSDGFAEAAFSVTGPLEGAWRFDAAAFHVDYFDLDAFDQAAVVAGGARRFGLGAWNNEAALHASYVLLDGDGFEQDLTLTLRGTVTLSPDWWFRATYRGSHVEGLDEFDGLSGSRHEAAARFDWRRQPWSASLAARFETNRADAEEFTYDWYQLGAELRWSAPALPLTVAIELAQRQLEHETAVDEDGNEKREDDRTIAALEAGWQLTQRVRLVGRYERQDNASNVAEFDYDRDRYYLGIEYAD
jgi:tetratricopeptide (TPR) repeat protein